MCHQYHFCYWEETPGSLIVLVRLFFSLLFPRTKWSLSLKPKDHSYRVHILLIANLVRISLQCCCCYYCFWMNTIYLHLLLQLKTFPLFFHRPPKISKSFPNIALFFAARGQIHVTGEFHLGECRCCLDLWGSPSFMTSPLFRPYWNVKTPVFVGNIVIDLWSLCKITFQSDLIYVAAGN